MYNTLPHHAATPDTAASRRDIAILLIEDSESDAFLTRQMLKRLYTDTHCIFTSVPRLTDAFTRLRHSPFDVIILDLNLLDFDGIVSVAVLHDEAPEVPLIVLSGMSDERLKERALQCGAAAYLVKGSESGEKVKDVFDQVLAQRKGNLSWS